MSKRDDETIILGSGNLHYTEFNGTLPSLEDIFTEETIVGAIQGGASIEYKPTFYEAKDDSGKLVKTILTDEEATLKTGIMSKIGQNLERLSSTARVSTSNGKRIVKIGGVGNHNGKSYVWGFHHIDKKDGDIYLIIVGLNQNGFTIAFAKDKETVVDAEIKCLPQDDEGTLIQYIEEIGEATAAANTDSASGDGVEGDEPTEPEGTE